MRKNKIKCFNGKNLELYEDKKSIKGSFRLKGKNPKIRLL